MQMVLGSNPAQCEMANKAFNHQDCRCCVNGSSEDCDLPLKVKKISSEWKRYDKRTIFSNRSLSEEKLLTALDNGNVVEIGIRWNGGGGHATLIVGCDRNDDASTYTVYDPLEGIFIGIYDDLKEAFGSGSWTWSWVVEQPFEEGS